MLILWLMNESMGNTGRSDHPQTKSASPEGDKAAAADHGHLFIKNRL